jgi:AraC-like DNA-binding protein
MQNNAIDGGPSVGRERAELIREAWMFQAASACQLMLCEVACPARNVAARVREISKTIPAPASKLEELLLHGMLFEVLLSAEPGASLGSRTSEAVERAVRGIGKKVCVQNRAVEAAAYIERHLIESLDVRGVARHAGCAETTLRRLFREEFDLSMRDYLTCLRVRQAIRTLAFLPNVGDLARAVGYESEKNFYTAIRHVTGATPAALRRRGKSALAKLTDSIVPKGRTANARALSGGMKVVGIAAA